MRDQTQGQSPTGGSGTAAPEWLAWDQAWQHALYAPDGFYRHQSPAAHFATSAQGLPGAGEILAEAVLALARRHGCRAVVDVGAGRGELLARLRALAPDLHLTGVDVVPAPDGLDVDGWLVSPGGADLPMDLAGLHDTLVFAHEWLDVVPCPVAVRDGRGPTGWRSVHVAGNGQERPGPALTGPDLAWARRWLGPQVARAEIGLPRDRAFTDLLSRVRTGLVLVVDYGHTAVDRPSGGTLAGFRGGREVPPAPDGTCDLTAHVAFDSLAQVASRDPGRCRLTTQGALLRELVGDPTAPVPHELARTDPRAYLAAVARRAALTTLTTSGGLGDFRWLLAPRRHPPA